MFIEMNEYSENISKEVWHGGVLREETLKDHVDGGSVVGMW